MTTTGPIAKLDAIKDRTSLAHDQKLTPLTAIETVRTLPTSRAVFDHAKIMYVMHGRVEVETSAGVNVLNPGMAFSLGARRWCRLRPLSSVRMWTLYADETFLRAQMCWSLPGRARLQAGVHPAEWDGGPLVLHPGLGLLGTMEPLWRQMNVLHENRPVSDAAAVRTLQLFARMTELVLPALLARDGEASFPEQMQAPIHGRLTDEAEIGHVGRAVRALRLHLAQNWSVHDLASQVSVSRSHLTRLFVAQTGIPPMRFLSSMRVTEFTRLIEETDMSIESAARTVGWTDSRVAAEWFARRFGMSPSRYRAAPHPHDLASSEESDPRAR
ncbi:MAG: AraC family transcriptional regulator [Arachnia sp.]